MGQYQQWLLFQEIDRRLRTELQTLETEIAQLQDEIHILEQAAPQAENVIVRALSITLNGHQPSINGVDATTDGRASQSAADIASDGSTPALSTALFSWGGLPNLGKPGLEESSPTINHSPSFDPQPEMALLPDDMSAFLDEHAQTEPQLELPWWLRNIAMATSISNSQRTGPVDQQALRTNRLVQRWLERWGRTPSTEQPPEENSHE